MFLAALAREDPAVSAPEAKPFTAPTAFSFADSKLALVEANESSPILPPDNLCNAALALSEANPAAPAATPMANPAAGFAVALAKLFAPPITFCDMLLSTLTSPFLA